MENLPLKDSQLPMPRIQNVLCGLSMSAYDTLYKHLKDEGSVGVARLAFHALRDAIDVCVRDLALHVNYRHRRPSDEALAPSLRRWPCCEAIRLELRQLDANIVSPEDIAELVALLFVDVPLAARQRIKRFKINWDGCVDIQLAVAQLPLWLPALKELDLSDDWPLLNDSPRRMQKLMYLALSNLHNLERLMLPGCKALEGVGHLAACSSLTSLAFTEPYMIGRLPAHNLTTAHISELSRLQQLHLMHCNLPVDKATGTSEMLQLLLSSLPPSLRHLQLEDCVIDGSFQDFDRTQTLDFQLEEGQLRLIQLDCTDLESPAMPVLLRSIPQQQQKPRLVIGELLIEYDEQLSDEQLAGFREKPLWEHFAATEVKAMCACHEIYDCYGRVAAVLQAADLLGPPQEFQFEVLGDFTITVSPSGPALLDGDMQQSGLAAAGGRRPLPSAGELLLSVMRRATAAAAQDAGGCAGSGSSGEHLLWVSGPLLDQMLEGDEGGWPRASIERWMNRLEDRAVQSTGDGSERCVVWYQELPAARAVVMQCDEKAAAEAVEAAVKELAVEAGTIGAAAEGLEAAAPLQVLRLWSRKKSPRGFIGFGCVRDAFIEAIQHAWDGAWEPSVGGIGQRRLGWLLALVDEICSRGRTVRTL
ncbi:hypothetical protein Agub_g14351 [Astrephomene gubernaculifera]|uniref:Uncharacterized protein n=1 Tax=Astrephomene gubernaculifera TaxID=47775 RepID=A0AAD3HTC8_9CHLO|nr:hypothetical protein Agub_g14351 [Astrephomene gubernaculifera]